MDTEPDITNAGLQIQKLHVSPAVWAKGCGLIQNPPTRSEDILEVIKLDASFTNDITRLSNTNSCSSLETPGGLASAIRRSELKEVYKFLGRCVSQSPITQGLDNYGLMTMGDRPQTVTVAWRAKQIAINKNLSAEQAKTLRILHCIAQRPMNQEPINHVAAMFWDGCMRARSLWKNHRSSRGGRFWLRPGSRWRGVGGITLNSRSEKITRKKRNPMDAKEKRPRTSLSTRDHTCTPAHCTIWESDGNHNEASL